MTNSMPKRKFELIPFLACVAIPLVLGTAAGLLTRNSMALYNQITQPPFAPPALVFPIVWSILYTLMGVSLYLIWQAGGDSKSYALFGAQLAFNLVWPFLFFTGMAFVAALVDLIALWILVLMMILAFRKISPVAAYLQIPYLIWLTFAAVLNVAVVILN